MGRLPGNQVVCKFVRGCQTGKDIRFRVEDALRKKIGKLQRERKGFFYEKKFWEAAAVFLRALYAVSVGEGG